MSGVWYFTAIAVVVFVVFVVLFTIEEGEQ